MWQIQSFPDGGRQPLRWRRQPIIWPNFPPKLHENKIRPRAGASLSPPVGSANESVCTPTENPQSAPGVTHWQLNRLLFILYHKINPDPVTKMVVKTTIDIMVSLFFCLRFTRCCLKIRIIAQIYFRTNMKMFQLLFIINNSTLSTFILSLCSLDYLSTNIDNHGI